MEKGYNKHHLNWCRSQWYRDGISKRIREHPGMIIPMRIEDHNALHKEIQPIKPPFRDLGVIALAHLHALDSTDPKFVIPLQADYLWYMAEADTQLGHEAFKYADHLEQQIAFIGLRRARAV
jgi:hypothetical protein